MLSDLQTKKLTRYFQLYDMDDDGRIEAADFARVVENVRILWGEDDRSAEFREVREAYDGFWNALRTQADGNGDAGIDLDEWLAYWQGALGDDERYEKQVATITDRLFTVFDIDGDGELGPSEFADFYGVFGLSVSLAETIFNELDADGDGRITREELTEISRQFYRGNDVEERGNMLFGPYGA